MVLSDIHGMLPVLDLVLQEPQVRDADLIVVTGDHTWGPQPHEVLLRLRALGRRAVLIRGNADRELLLMSRGVNVGLADDSVSVWGATQLTVEDQQMLAAMPEQVVVEIAGFGPVLFCHATPRDDEEVALVDSTPARWLDVLSDVPAEVQTVVCGHTHMPFVRLVDRRLVVNPGSVGLPYGREGAHWAVLQDGAVTIRRTRYNPNLIAAAVRAASTMPTAEEWVREALQPPASDLEALATFTPRAEPTDPGNVGAEPTPARTSSAVEQVLAAERRTLDAACRADPACIDQFLADDFHEYGASGGSITRDGMADRVAAATDLSRPPIDVEDLLGQELADGIVLVKYTAINDGRRTHRTSLWRRTASGEWRLFYHQGTITAD
ncbi:MAG: metallophosphoesterase family protein [Curtobacterium sp.]